MLETLLQQEQELTSAIARLEHIRVMRDMSHFGWSLLYSAGEHLKKQRKDVGARIRGYFIDGIDEVTA